MRGVVLSPKAIGKAGIATSTFSSVAGASGLLAAGAGLGGADPTITIPSVRISLADGNKLKGALNSNPGGRSSGVVVLPCGAEAARAELRRVLLDGGYERGVAAIDDPDLADQ